MWSTVFSSPAAYLFLAWIMLLAVLFAIAKPERRPPTTLTDVDLRFSWKWLKPVPVELRPLMRQAARGQGFAQDVLASCAAEFDARFTEEIQRIRQ